MTLNDPNRMLANKPDYLLFHHTEYMHKDVWKMVKICHCTVLVLYQEKF